MHRLQLCICRGMLYFTLKLRNLENNVDIEPLALFCFFGVFSYALLIKFSSYAFDLHNVWEQFTCPHTIKELRHYGRTALLASLILTVLSLLTMFGVLRHEMNVYAWAFSHIPAGVFFLYWCDANEASSLLKRWGVDDSHVQYKD